MNRETGMLESTDRLIVVDRSRRRTAVIVAAVAIGLLALLAAYFLMRGGDEAAKAPRAGAVPTVTVIVPGKTSVARVITASGALGARRDEPVGVAGDFNDWSIIPLVDGGGKLEATVVVADGRPVGILHVHDLLRAGVM